MGHEAVISTPVLSLQALLVLLLLGVTAGLAAVMFMFQSPQPRGRTRPIAPHPSQPASMFALVALPTFLTFTSLVVRFPAMVIVPGEHPINSPDSHRRHLSAPVLLDVVDVDGDGSRRFVYPANTADLTADAARRVESESPGERIDAIRDLAWWTGVCPNYAPFTIPVLVRALGDADPAVKGATAVAIGSIGGNASAAVPGPIAARGTSVHYFDFILEEAIALIEHSPTWPPAEACEMVALEELAR